MKRMTLCIMISCIVIFICGCQKTPQEGIVKYREEEQYTERAEEHRNDAVLQNVPAHITEQITEYNGKVTLNLDADIEVLERNAWPVYRTALHRITNEEAERFVRAFVGDAVLKNENKAKTKEDIMREIQDYQTCIQEIRAGSDAYDQSIADFEALIAEAKECLEDAPLKSDYEIVSFGAATEYIDSLSLFADVREEANPTFVLMDDAYGAYLVYSDNGRKGLQGFRGCDTYTELISSDTVTKIIKKEKQTAIDEAIAFVEQLGIADMGFEGTVLDYGYCTTDIFTYDHCAYGVIFTREFNDIPRAYLKNDSTQYILDVEGEQYSASAANEVLMVVVDDGGVAEIVWTAPDDVTMTETEDVALVDFEKVEKAFRDALKVKYAYVERMTEEEDAESGNIVLNIRKIKLSYAKIGILYNVNEKRIVPTWVLYDENDEAILAINATDMSTVA